MPIRKSSSGKHGMENPGPHPNQPAASSFFACSRGSSPGQTTPLLAHPLPGTLAIRLDPIGLPEHGIEMMQAQDRDTRAKVREACPPPGAEDLIRSRLKSWARETTLPAQKSDRIRQNLILKAGEVVLFEVQDKQDRCTRSQIRGAGS
jgi:hypothetical protein